MPVPQRNVNCDLEQVAGSLHGAEEDWTPRFVWQRLGHLMAVSRVSDDGIGLSGFFSPWCNFLLARCGSHLDCTKRFVASNVPLGEDPGTTEITSTSSVAFLIIVLFFGF